MASSPMSEVVHHLRRAALAGDGAGVTDGQLLESFVSRRDADAFAELVRRHGPMVWGVCRRTLGNRQDAEDAFQAAFLVLVRRASSVVPRSQVANWLYGVAHQTALKARAVAAKRKGRERQVTQMPEPAAVDGDVGRDLEPLLDRELSRLPDKYRSVIVLCELEGRTRREAAQHLGVPEGTVAGWLARARALLARRLKQRGLALAPAALAAALTREASARAPAALIAETIRAAGPWVAGPAAGAISPQVATLTDGVLKTMLMTKLSRMAAFLAMVCAATLGGAAHFSRADPSPDGVAPPAAPQQRQAGERPQRPKEQGREGTTVSGKLEAVDAAKNTVTVTVVFNRTDGPVEKTYQLAKDARIQQDGALAKIADLKKGNRVMVRLSADEKTAVGINVTGVTVTAPLKSVDAARSTLTITTETRQGKQEKTYQVAKDAKLLIDGKETALGDLKEGTPLVLTLSAAQENTVIQVRTPGRRERE